MPVLTRSQSLGLAGRFADAATEAADADTAGTLFDLVADLINHANGHPVPWLTAGPAHAEDRDCGTLFPAGDLVAACTRPPHGPEYAHEAWADGVRYLSADAQAEA